MRAEGARVGRDWVVWGWVGRVRGALERAEVATGSRDLGVWGLGGRDWVGGARVGKGREKGAREEQDWEARVRVVEGWEGTVPGVKETGGQGWALQGRAGAERVALGWEAVGRAARG